MHDSERQPLIIRVASCRRLSAIGGGIFENLWSSLEIFKLISRTWIALKGERSDIGRIIGWRRSASFRRAANPTPPSAVKQLATMVSKHAPCEARSPAISAMRRFQHLSVYF